MIVPLHLYKPGPNLIKNSVIFREPPIHNVQTGKYALKASAKDIICCLSLMLFSLTGYAQYAWLDSVKEISRIQNPDTNKVRSLIIISDRSLSLNPDSALNYGLRALHLSENLQYEMGIFWSEYAINGALYYLGNYPLELQYCFMALSLAKKMNTEQEIVNAYCMLSDYYYNRERI